jgi:hypothetical protein
MTRIVCAAGAASAVLPTEGSIYLAISAALVLLVATGSVAVGRKGVAARPEPGAE